MNNATPRTRVRRGVLATIVIVVATALGVVGLTTSGASAGHQDDGPKPTIVLVHGGWADSSGWNAEIATLQKRGYPVIAPANPLRGLASDAAYIHSVLTTIDGPIVLVGHSYGGAVISNAAVGVPNVEALVYIAGFAPDAGESLVQLVTMNPGSEIGPATLIARPYPLPRRWSRNRPLPHPGRIPHRLRRRRPRQDRRPDASHPATLLRSGLCSRCPASPPGRRSRPGTSSPPRTRRSHRRHSDSWPNAPAPPPSRSVHPTCR